MSRELTAWIGLAVSVIMIIVACIGLAGCRMPQGSWTSPPTCKAGYHVEHAPSHQGHVWDCVKNS